MSKSYARTKKKFISTAIGSFIGIMAAIPVAMGIYSPGALVGATDQNATSSAEVSGIPADFAQYAYAFSQGYAAKATSSAAGSSATAGSTCGDSTATAGTGGSQVLGDSTNKPSNKPEAGIGEIIHSYNEYKSFVYNSSTSTINNTNSNNTVGSNNTTKTDIEVEDSKGVLLGVSNTTTGTNISSNDSFNNESYNTKTETENVAVNKVEDSYNTKTETENVAVNKVEDSYNTKTETETTTVDVDKTETNEATFNNDSNNTTETTISDNEVDIEVEADQNKPCPPSV